MQKWNVKRYSKATGKLLHEGNIFAHSIRMACSLENYAMTDKEELEHKKFCDQCHNLYGHMFSQENRHALPENKRQLVIIDPVYN